MSDARPVENFQIDIHGAIQRHLPYLRRFARALTGSQDRGDAFAAETLEAIIEKRETFDAGYPEKVALYRVFYSIWSNSDAICGTAPTNGTDVEATAHRRLASLTAPSRAAYLLGALEDFSPRDTASIMNLPDAEAARLHENALAEIEKQMAARILIIEDEPIIAMDIESIVVELGHESVGVADTRNAAVNMAEEHHPDLILSDIQLADGSSGVDAAHDILAKSAVPIIFITAFPERLLTGERPEPTFLITKPFKRSAVQAAVSQALFFGSAEAITI